MAGKPDLIAVKGGDAVIIDAKTGKPSAAHSAQVMVYQYAVPKSLEQYRGMEFRGHVIYPDGNVQIPASGVDGKFVERLGASHPEAGGGDAGPAGTQRWGVPVLRHHSRGLPGAGGEGGRRPRRNDARLLGDRDAPTH